MPTYRLTGTPSAPTRWLQVPAAGFRWTAPDEHTPRFRAAGPWLVAAGRPGADLNPAMWEPAEAATFAHVFEALATLGPEPDPAAVLPLANRFGFLRGDDLEPVPLLFPVVRGKRRGPLVRGERLSRWHDEVGKLRRAREVYANLDHPRTLRTLIEVDRVKRSPKRARAGAIHTVRYVDAGRLILLPRLRVNQWKLAALALLADDVNHHLAVGVDVAATLDREGERCQGVRRPRTLLGGAWLGLFELLTEGVAVATCKRCGEPFTIGGGKGRRADAQFCSQRCARGASVTRYRQRKRKSARALELRRVGKTVNAIAKELGEGAETVRDWLEEGPP